MLSSSRSHGHKSRSSSRAFPMVETDGRQKEFQKEGGDPDMSLNRFQNAGATNSNHAYNLHTITKHPWKNSKFLNKKFRKSTRSVPGSDNATITTESTGLSSQSSLLSKPFASPVSSKKTYPSNSFITPETQSSPCSPQSPSTGTTSPGRLFSPSLALSMGNSSLSSNVNRERARSAARSTRGIDANDEMTKPPPPSPRFRTSPKSMVSSARPRSLSNHSRCSSAGSCSFAGSALRIPQTSPKSMVYSVRPKSLSNHSRCSSFGSCSSAGSALRIPHPPKNLRRTTASPSPSTLQTNLVAAANPAHQGPIDVDSMEAWQEDASVESSLLMMGIEDPTDALRNAPVTSLATTQAVEKRWTDLSSFSNRASRAQIQKAPIASDQTSETLPIEESPTWSQEGLEDDTLELSSDGSAADDEFLGIDLDDEQDLNPLAPFMRIDHMDDLLAESDSEDDYLELRRLFPHGLPILDEREDERILCGYVKGFDAIPETIREKGNAPPQHGVSRRDRAFEI